MSAIETLEKEIDSLKMRNKKVEADKSWETSHTRKISVAVLTYFIILIFFLIKGIDDPFISAIVPTLGFLLSTSGLDFIKRIWLKRIYKNRG